MLAYRVLTGVLLATATQVWGADEDFVGEWDLTLTQGRRVMEGRMQIRQVAGSVVGHVEGGLIRLRLENTQIEIGVDDRTATGMPFERYLRGALENGVMSGTFGPENPPPENIKVLCEKLPLACPAPTGTWSATPHLPDETNELAKNPVDLSGAWVMAQSGIRRWTSDLTEVGKDRQEQFDVKLDLPNQRCQSLGLVSGWGFRGNDPEIYQTDDKVSIVLGSEVRRIYLDERRPPEHSDWYPLGFSSGHWEGSTLVVETTFLQPAVREWNGDPISENARVVERYSIDDNGQLVGALTLHDPENYNEPPIKRARWRRTEDSAIRFPSLCDPDSFYRELYDEGKMEDYWERAHRRF